MYHVECRRANTPPGWVAPRRECCAIFTGLFGDGPRAWREPPRMPEGKLQSKLQECPGGVRARPMWRSCRHYRHVFRREEDIDMNEVLFMNDDS
eukprot:11187525-Karenia_brevis.AAC.1